MGTTTLVERATSHQHAERPEGQTQGYQIHTGYQCACVAEDNSMAKIDGDEAENTDCALSEHAGREHFNGGKMAHVFAFDQETRLYSSEIASDAASEALVHGDFFYKVDGSNGMLIREADGAFSAYQRLDTRGRPIPDGCIRLPKGANIDTYTGHSYCYETIRADVEGKKAKKRNQAMLDVVARHGERLCSFGLGTVSIEWVGAKFNKTPGVPQDVAIAVHAEQVCSEDIIRTSEGMKSFLLEANPPIEGLIIENKGVYWKIRSDCFDRKCLFKTDTASARPPIYNF